MYPTRSIKITETAYKTLIQIRDAVKPKPTIASLVADMIDRYKIKQTPKAKR